MKMNMPTDAAIKIYLLRKQPEVWVDGVLQDINPQALKLLIVMADKGDQVYSREELTAQLYGIQIPETRDALRKQALFYLRKTLPQETVINVKRDLLQLQHTDLWIDSRAFFEQGEALLQAAPSFGSEEYEEAKSILLLYQTPFLGDFLLKAGDEAGNRNFTFRQKKRRDELARCYHRLLERVVEYLLKQQDMWGEAQSYAELWWHSPASGLKPLHYLIWLGVQRHSADLHQYMDELHERETKGEPQVGRNWESWNKLIKQERLIPLEELFAPTVAKPATEQFERPEILQQLVKLLTSPREQRMFGLVGLPGSGKTEMAQMVVKEMRAKHPDHPVVLVELAAAFDHESLCNSILIEMGMHALLSLDIGRKKQRLKQLLETPNQVVIVDEGYSQHLADTQVVDDLRELLGRARVMLVARKLPDYQYYEIKLEGLDARQVRNFLLDQSSWLQSSNATDFETLAALIFGLPLALNIIVGGLKRQRVRLQGVIEHLKEPNSSLSLEANVTAMYQSLIGWLWTYLLPPEKNLLYTISLFAPEVGVTADALRSVLTHISTLSLPPHLQNLVDLRLIKERESQTGELYYSLHPIVLQYVQDNIPPTNKHVQRIKQSFVRFMLDYVTAHYNNFELLDNHRQNLLEMFEMVLVTDQYPMLQLQAVNTFSQLHPYFERCGLYVASLNLLLGLNPQIVLPPVTQVEILFQKGKLAKFLTQFDVALDAFERALSIAREINLPDRFGGLYNNIGDMLLQTGHYVEALASFHEAEKWARETQHRPLLYAVWSNIANCYFYQGQFDVAQQYYEKVSQHLEGDLDSLPEILKRIAQHNQNALGLNSIEIGRYTEAIAYFQRGLELARDLNYQEQTGFLYLNLGVAYYFLGDFTTARASFAQAYTIANDIQHLWLRTDVMWNQGALASSQFLHAEAFQLLRQALIAVEEYQLYVIKPRVLSAFGKAYLRIEQYDAAHNAFRQTLDVPKASMKHTASALYGQVLSTLLKTYPVGNQNVETARMVVDELLESLPIHALGFFAMPLDSIKRYLEKAGAIFQYELSHMPMLERYRIVEALSQWFDEHPVSS